MKNEKNESLDVLLIDMPFGINFTPPLGLSLLNAAVKKKGFTSHIKYYSLKFSQIISREFYMLITQMIPTDLFGEWLFAKTLFPDLPDDQEYINNILKGKHKEHLKNQKMSLYAEQLIPLIPEIKCKTEPFINDCLAEVMAARPKIVGFSTSFQQNIASFSLAKRIKEHLPQTIIVFGGANCEGKMGIEIIKKFPFIDIVFSGEADEIFPELVSNIISKQEYSHQPGVICRQNLAKFADNVIVSPMVMDMENLPVPDYDDYLEQFEYYFKEKLANPLFLIESSRGCWWGEISHCTFCGLNGNTMLHRSKTAVRFLDEIKYLIKKYHVKRFSVVDKILDLSYFKDFIPMLAKENLDLQLFYEVKSNLTKEQIRLLKEAKINRIQPGIESFSTHVLDLMKKGVKAIQNVQLLKWCKEIGLRTSGGLIYGFPGETKEDYYEMAALIPKISHLNPPNNFYVLTLDRFSPNFNFPEKFGIKKIYNLPSYDYIYPFEAESKYNLAFQFAYQYDKDDNFDLALEAARGELYKWKAESANTALFFIDQEDALVVFDLRVAATKPYYILYAKERFLYLLCDKIQPIRKIINEYSKFFETETDESEIQAILNSIIDKNLMIRENNSYLSLAIPLGAYMPSQEIMKTLFSILKNRPEGDNQVMITDKNELLIQLNG